MKLRFLLMSIWVGECSSSSLSFCSWPDGTHRNPKEREWGRGRGHHRQLASPPSNTPLDPGTRLGLPHAEPRVTQSFGLPGA